MQKEILLKCFPKMLLLFQIFDDEYGEKILDNIKAKNIFIVFSRRPTSGITDVQRLELW